jgi:hypothetical protein
VEGRALDGSEVRGVVDERVERRDPDRDRDGLAGDVRVVPRFVGANLRRRFPHLVQVLELQVARDGVSLGLGDVGERLGPAHVGVFDGCGAARPRCSAAG